MKSVIAAISPLVRAVDHWRWGRATYLPDIFGHAMHVDPEDSGFKIYRLRRSRGATGELGYIARNLCKASTAIDIGANVGLITLLMARQVGPRGKVIAFEPGPKSFDLLSKNIAANGYENITAENVAVCDRTGEIDLFVCRSGESDNRIAGTVSDLSGRDCKTVKCTRLDDYLATHGIAQVDFIKIDVQGAEMMALRGMTETLRRNHRIEVIIEYVPGAIAGATPSEFLDFLASLGFDLFNLPEEGREHPVTSAWLLDNIGQPNKPPLTNLVLRRPSI